MTLEDIQQYWQEVGQQFPSEGRVTPTSRDIYLAQLEADNICDYLEANQIALEIGCGDGAHTMKYAARVKKLSGIDIAESLIYIAKNRAISDKIHNVDFTVGSVLDLKKTYQGKQFDCVISQRCLINLPEWEYQQDAILKVHSLLKKGGLFLVTEGFQDELNNLNIVREKLGLASIKVVNYNRNLVRGVFEAFVRNYFSIEEIRHYGVYLFLSRVFHPLAIRPEEPKHDSKLNEAAMKIANQVILSDFEKYSYNLFYVLKKR